MPKATEPASPAPDASGGSGLPRRLLRILTAPVRWVVAPIVFFALNPLMLPLAILPAAYFQRLWKDDLPGAGLAAAGALAYGAVLFALRGRSFMSLLAVRYLFKRRIAIVAVLSVTLCTAMVLAVASIMEGFMKSAREAMHKAKGDLTLQGDWRGFPFYEEFSRRVEAGHESLRDPETGKPAVRRAAALMNSLAMAEIPWGAGEKINPVRVVGVRPEDMASDENFKAGLDPGDNPVRITDDSLVKLKADGVPAGVLKALTDQLRNIPFGSKTEFEFRLAEVLPKADLSAYGAAISARLAADPPATDKADGGRIPVLGPRRIHVRDKTFNGGGFVVGKDMVSVRDSQGKLHPMISTLRPMRLTLLPPDAAGKSDGDMVPIKVLFQWEANHRSGVYDQDRGTVYVDFAFLQEKLAVGPRADEGVPAYCSAIQIDLAEGVSLDRGRRIIARAWNKMCAEIEAEQRAWIAAPAGAKPAFKVGPNFPLRNDEFVGSDGKPFFSFPDLNLARHRGGFTGLAKDAAAGSLTLPVSSTAGFDAGDQIRIGTAGEFEQNYVEEILPGALRLRSPLKLARQADALRGGGTVRTIPSGAVEAVTWEENMATFLMAVQKEKVMMLILFGIISMVAVLLVLSIFIQIVKEKTRDIGIIKSVGAGNGAVAGVFLLYALCIGAVGSLTGTLLGSAFVWNINEIHDVIANMTGVIIWDPAVYVLPKIPHTVSALDTAWVAGIAVVASLVAAVVPAALAARLPPVRALAYE